MGSDKKNKCSGMPLLYSVWNNFTDELVILDGTARQCADAMGISFSTFHPTKTRTKQGKLHKWTFEETLIREMEADE